jgi:hypothetical protein
MRLQKVFARRLGLLVLLLAMTLLLAGCPKGGGY